MGSLSVGVWLNCVCLCISTPPSLWVWLFFWGLVRGACRGARCLAETTRLLDSTDGSNNVSIDENVTERKRGREKGRQSNRWDGDRSAVIIWLQSTSFTVTKRLLTRGTRLLGRRTEASTAQICHFTSEICFDLTCVFADLNQTTNSLGFPLQCYFAMQVNYAV